MEMRDDQMAGLKMDRNAAVRTAGHKTQQDLAHSTSAQSLFSIFQVKIQFKSLPSIGAASKRIAHRVTIKS
jgi:hypothetical protein